MSIKKEDKWCPKPREELCQTIMEEVSSKEESSPMHEPAESISCLRPQARQWFWKLVIRDEFGGGQEQLALWGSGGRLGQQRAELGGPEMSWRWKNCNRDVLWEEDSQENRTWDPNEEEEGRMGQEYQTNHTAAQGEAQGSGVTGIIRGNLELA